MRVAGTETRPGIYLFHLMFKEGHYYNNQYFTDPNERQIIGPFVATTNAAEPASRRRSTSAAPVGEIQVVVAQTFSRLSYDVPSQYKRPLRPTE